MSTNQILPRLPYRDFPLRPHRNGQWYKSVWNPRLKKTEQYYFGPWHDDPKGERALHDRISGWLTRRDAIRAGVDNVRVGALAESDIALGELMAKFLAHKREQVLTGELARRTLGEYIEELQRFVSFMKPATPAAGLRPEHFAAYVHELITRRKLGRHARRRVRAYVNCFLRFGVVNGWFAMPATGVQWTAPATDPDSMRVAKARNGESADFDRIVSGKELRRLLRRASPTFKALILLGVNAGLGPADLARLRWRAIDLGKRQLVYPRGKTGVPRRCYLWRRTRRALQRVQQLKYNKLAIDLEGSDALVFVTRTGRPFYREKDKFIDVDVDGKSVRKLAGVQVENAVSSTFGRMCRELKIKGLGFYRLRHTLRTLGLAARDREALDAITGHRDGRASRAYEHAPVAWKRIKRVSLLVQRRLWRNLKRKEDSGRENVPAGDDETIALAKSQ